MCSAADVQTMNHLTLQLQQSSFNALWSCWGVFLVTFKIIEITNRKKVQDCPHDSMH